MEKSAAESFKMFDLRPFAMLSHFGLKNPIFLETAAYGHVGREPFTKKVKFYTNGNVNGAQAYEKEVEFFGMEKLDYDG